MSGFTQEHFTLVFALYCAIGMLAFALAVLRWLRDERSFHVWQLYAYTFIAIGWPAVSIALVIYLNHTVSFVVGGITVGINTVITGGLYWLLKPDLPRNKRVYIE